MANGPYKVTEVRQTPKAVSLERGSQGAGDKLRIREGNNPDRQLRSLNPS